MGPTSEAKQAPMSLGTGGVFACATGLMALKPLLLHVSSRSAAADEQIGADAASPPPGLPPMWFQIYAEVTKVLVCAAALATLKVLGRPTRLWVSWAHTRAFMMPAAVYLLMNVLTVQAARRLAPPTFQLIANTKIICTAVVAWLINGRPITGRQWAALAALIVGVVLGQFGQDGASGAGATVIATDAVGVCLMVVNSWLSAFGGVLTEGVLKTPGSAAMSVWARNIHMALHTLAINVLFLSCWGTAGQVDGDKRESGFPGLAPLKEAHTAAALINEAVNGIVISLLICRLDAVVKNFAFGVSVFVTAALSAALLGLAPGWNFYLGSTITCASLALYTSGGGSVPGAVPSGSKGQRPKTS